LIFSAACPLMNALDLLYIPVALLTAPWWVFKRRAGWRERFGKIEPLPARTQGGGAGHRPRILLHAVSVGEVAALRYIVPLLAGEADVVISTTTDSGMWRARALYQSSCTVVRYPLDFSWAVERFLDAVRPDVIGLVELEVWPNFVRLATRRGIAVGVINGRLSERSARGYRKIRHFFGRALGRLDFVAAQDQTYVARFIELGASAERCCVTGTMKWDAANTPVSEAAAESLAKAMGIDRGLPLIVAGSTGPTEEALLVEACPRGAQLLCAPRKPERFDAAAEALAIDGARVIRRSGGGNAARVEGRGGASPRFLLDSIGELSAAYSLATVVVMGRSFNDQYGSDPIEPIACGKATVIGPAVADFSTVVAALLTQGGIVQSSREELGGVLATLVYDAGRRGQLVEKGLACLAAHRGASARHAELLLRVARRGREGVVGAGLSQ